MDVLSLYLNLNMIDEFDKRIEAILGALLYKANKDNVELVVDTAFEDSLRRDLSCIVHRPDNNRFALMSVNVREYPDEPVVFFLFNSQLYEYAKMEGFDTEGMLTGGFDNMVFIKTDIEGYFNYLLEDGE